jgi:hypothetical protein
MESCIERKRVKPHIKLFVFLFFFILINNSHIKTDDAFIDELTPASQQKYRLPRHHQGTSLLRQPVSVTPTSHCEDTSSGFSPTELTCNGSCVQSQLLGLPEVSP